MSNGFPLALIAGTGGGAASVFATALDALVASLDHLQHVVRRISTVEDGHALVASNSGIGSVLVDWELAGTGEPPTAAMELVEAIRARNVRVPIFVLMGRGGGGALVDVHLLATRQVQEYVWLLEDTPRFIAGRVDFAAREYLRTLLPPFFAKLKAYGDEHAYNWDAPGHMGGIAFLKSPAGRVFHEYYGENILRTDVGINISALGSLIDHVGPIREAEDHAAEVFGADRTFFVLNGSSTSNRMVTGMSRDGDVVLIGRSCHTSVNYGLIHSGARPLYVQTTRNALGIAGPASLSEIDRGALTRLMRQSGLGSRLPRGAVLTNGTYDGLCYNVGRLVDVLGEVVDRIHLDEAWFGYAKFHPLFRGRFAMGIDPAKHKRLPTLLSVQSTHKLLAAFSQASMIHLRHGNTEDFDEAVFEEAFASHASTSPFYPMIASIDVGTALMEEPSGRALTEDAVIEAIRFRRAVVNTARHIRQSAGSPDRRWFFSVWQPEAIAAPTAEEDQLASEPSGWLLKNDARWHGFTGLAEDSYCLLDPTKVTITTPGVDASGRVQRVGIPAVVVKRFLAARRRIEISKVGDYTILVHFSIGTTHGKWGTLLDALLEFKQEYDGGSLLRESIPDLGDVHPRGETLRSLCQRMHSFLTARGAMMHVLRERALAVRPPPALSPRDAWQRTLDGKSGLVRLDDIAGRVAAVMVVPYPPGIPILLPGEQVSAAAQTYLSRLAELGKELAGFTSEVHGVYLDEHEEAFVRCLKE